MELVPAVPTAVIVACSWLAPESMVTGAPAARLATLVTLMFVSPGAAAAYSFSDAAEVPTAVICADCADAPVPIVSGPPA